MTRSYKITAHGTPMGTYEGSTVIEALDAYAKDAGYEGWDDLKTQHDANDLEITADDGEKYTA